MDPRNPTIELEIIYAIESEKTLANKIKYTIMAVAHSANVKGIYTDISSIYCELGG
jgi:hypothetical protein